MKSLDGRKSTIHNISHLCPLFLLFLGQNSSAGKLKTLFGALDIMVKAKGAFQLIRKELVAESEQVKKKKSSGLIICSLVSLAFL